MRHCLLPICLQIGVFKAQKILEPKIFLISAPSGAGKTTLTEACLPFLPNLKRAITHTTRKPRSNQKEQNAVDYYFVSDQEFEEGIKQGAFLEWQAIYQYKYGTSFQAVEDVKKMGKHVLLVIDVEGARSLRKLHLPNLFSIFIHVPTVEEILARLSLRKTESKEDIQERISRYQEEISSRYEFDCVLINRNFQQLTQNFVSLVRAFSL